MKPYVIKQGECIELLAARHGVSTDDIWQHDDNEEIRGTRSDPRVLAPGDVVYVPSDPVEKPTISSGGTHKFKAKGALTTVTIRLQDGSGQGVADKPYRLAVGRATYEGQTDGDGVVEARIPIAAHQGELSIWPGGTADEG